MVGLSAGPARLFRPAHDPGTDRRGRQLERTIRRLHGLALLLFAIVISLPAFGQPTDPLALSVRILIVVLDVAVALDLQVRGERASQLVLLLAALPLVGVLARQPLPGDVATGLVLTAVSLSAVRLLERRWYVAALPVIGILYVAGRAAVSVPMLVGLDDFLLTAGLTFSGGAFVDALETAAERASDADSRRVALRRRLDADAAERAAVDAARRALHDEVLTALRTLTDQAVEDARAREGCASAVAAIEEVAAGVESAAADRPALADMLAELVDSAPVGVDLELEHSLPTTGLSPVVEQALWRACGEALRNVGRHAGVVRATLRLRGADGQLIAEVVDRGRGVPGDFRSGFGLKESVFGVVAAAGGRAEVIPTPGGGTTVRLWLPAESRGASRHGPWSTYDLTLRAVGTAGSMIAAVGWPQGLAWCYLALRYSAGEPAMMALAVAITGLTAVVAVTLSRRAPTTLDLAVLWCGLLVVHLIGLSLSDAGALLDYRSWYVGYVAVVVLLLTMFVPAWVGCVFVASHVTLLVLVWRVAPWLADGAFPWGSVNAVVMTPVLGMAVGALLRRMGRTISAEDERAAHASLRLAAERSIGLVSSLHLEHTRRVVIPWLAAVAAGQVDLRAPATLERARTLALEVRDDLYAPGFLDEPLRRQVSGFRSRGGTLEIRPGFSPGAANRTVGALLRRLLDGLDPVHKVTASPPAATGVPGRLAIVPPVETLGPTDGARIESDDFRTVIEFEDVPDVR